MPYFNLRPDFITVLLQNNLATPQLFMTIRNCVGISDRPQHAQDVNTVLSDMTLITLPLWSVHKTVC